LLVNPAHFLQIEDKLPVRVNAAILNFERTNLRACVQIQLSTAIQRIAGSSSYCEVQLKSTQKNSGSAGNVAIFHLKLRDSLRTLVLGIAIPTLYDIRESTKNFHCAGEKKRKRTCVTCKWPCKLHYLQLSRICTIYRDAIANMYAHTDGGMDRPLFGEARPRVSKTNFVI